MAISFGVPTKYFWGPVTNLIFGGITIYGIENRFLWVLHIIYTFLLVGIFGVFYIVTEVIHIMYHLNDLVEVTFTLCYLIAHTVAVIKVIIFHFKKVELGKCLMLLESAIFLPNMERGGLAEFKIIKGAIKSTRTQAKIFLACVVIMLSTRILSCLRQSTTEISTNNVTITAKVLPYPSTLPFDIDVSVSPNYEIVFSYQIISIALFGWYLGNTDVILNGMIIHVTAQFKLVSHSLRTLTERAGRIKSNMNSTHLNSNTISKLFNRQANLHKFDEDFQENVEKRIKNCIKHHQATLNLIALIEKHFTILFLVQFMGSLLCMCVGLYQSSLLPISNPTSLSMLGFTSALGFEILSYCWNGHNLSIEGLGVAMSAYKSDWICTNKFVKECLILIMFRAQKSSFLSIGKFSFISLELFVKILKGSVSYFMVLKNFNSEQGDYSQN